MHDESVRRLGQIYLVLQSVGAAAWWVMLLAQPATRQHFLAPRAPDETLIAFLLPDVVLFIGAGFAAAWALGATDRRPWGWPVLCVHAGAAAYAAMYCIALAALTGAAWAGAAMMAPSLVVTPWLAWRLRPRGAG